MQITYLERKFAAFDLEPPKARTQFADDWKRIAFDMESIRKSYAMVDTKDRSQGNTGFQGAFGAPRTFDWNAHVCRV